MKILVDTCVVVDLLQKRKGFIDDAKEIFTLVSLKKVGGVITAKSVTDVYYLCHKLTHSGVVTRDILGKLFTIFEVEDSTGQDCKRALLSKVADYEDAVMVETALRIGVDCIVTRNVRDFKKAVVKVMTPREFLDTMGWQ